MFPNLDMTSPLSLYSIPVVWFTSFYPSSLRILTIEKHLGYDNEHARSNTTAKFQEKKLSPKVISRLRRLEGAHLNGNEAFPLWVAAVLAGNYAGLDTHWMNKMAVSYTLVRLLYNTVYINPTLNAIAAGWFRTVVFFFGVSFPIRILIKAAAKAANR